MNTVSSRKSFAALINFMACTVNAGLAWWLYNKGSDFYVFNTVCAVFSGVLAVGNFIGYIDAKDAETRDKIFKDIYGR